MMHSCPTERFLCTYAQERSMLPNRPLPQAAVSISYRASLCGTPIFTQKIKNGQSTVTNLQKKRIYGGSPTAGTDRNTGIR